MLLLTDIFKSDVSSSSSHTTGPMLASLLAVLTNGTLKAINAARIALSGDGEHTVSLDNAIDTMQRSGEDMHDKYKETAQGSLAVSYTEC